MKAKKEVKAFKKALRGSVMTMNDAGELKPKTQKEVGMRNATFCIILTWFPYPEGRVRCEGRLQMVRDSRRRGDQHQQDEPRQYETGRGERRAFGLVILTFFSCPYR